MNCSEMQRALPEGMEGLEPQYKAHLQSCADCAELVAELELVASESRQLGETDEPPQRVWVKIAAELRAEGIIRDPETAPARAAAVPAARSRWNSWWLVPVAAALVAAGSYVIQPKATAPATVGQQANAPAVAKPQSSTQVANNTAPANRPAAQQQRPSVQSLDNSSKSAPMMAVSTSDQALLNGVSPQMRPAYENQLRAVNAYIQDADAYLRQNPDDEDARQHLMDAYEQREMLYQMALDHVQ